MTNPLLLIFWICNFAPSNPDTRMRRLLLITVAFLSCIAAGAQEIDEKDAFATWTDVIIRKDFNKWHVGGLLEYCTVDKGYGMTHNEVILRPIVGYNPLEWLRLQGQVDFLYSFYSGFCLRYLADITFHAKASDFRFSLRNRLQLTHDIYSGKVSPVIRTRLKTDYLIPKTPVSLHVAAEPYWLKHIVKCRFYFGADIKVHKNLSISADYIRYPNYKPDVQDHNVIYLSLYVRL